jgi:hypothetical protein
MTGRGMSMKSHARAKRYILPMVHALNNGRRVWMTCVGIASGKITGGASWRSSVGKSKTVFYSDR